MPRFFLHLLDDLDVPDEEGVELPDLDAARDCARRHARFTAAETLKEQGRIVLSHSIRIEDEQGNVLDTIYFADVVRVES